MPRGKGGIPGWEKDEQSTEKAPASGLAANPVCDK